MVCHAGLLSLKCFTSSAVSLIVFILYLHELIDYLTIFVWSLLVFITITILLYFKSNDDFQIAIRAIFLGIVFGTGALLAYLGPLSWKPFGYYGLILATFHYSEFLAVAISNPKALSTDSFILNHSIQYAAAAASSWIEFLVEVYLWPDLKTYTLLTIIGITLCIIGETMRKLAIITASSNFNHVVQFNKADDHQLVTHGIYKYMRHPSYVGWFWWSIGTQITLINPICIIIYTIASWTFFNHRVLFEEITLINFFGYQYIKYQKDVPTGLPFIKGYILE